MSVSILQRHGMVQNLHKNCSRASIVLGRILGRRMSLMSYEAVIRRKFSSTVTISFPTYGIGSEYSSRQWQSILRQLITHGFVRVDHDHFSVLRLTSTSYELLRGDVQLQLHQDTQMAVDQIQKKPKEANEIFASYDQELWNALRAERYRLAEMMNLPAYAIFHNSTLKEFVAFTPQNAR